MKHFLTISALFIAVHLNAQQKDTIEQYCVMKTYWGGFLSETTVEIDYGQEAIHVLRNRLKDTITGKLIKFKSPVDALNFMGKQGWKLINAIPNGSDSNSYIYVLRKEVLKDDIKE